MLGTNGVSLWLWCCPRKAETRVWFPVPDKLSLKVVDAEEKKDFQDLRTLIAESSSGDFLTVILPEKPLPKPKKLGMWYGFTHSLEWKDCTDLLAVGIPPKSSTAPLPPQLKMVRISRRDLGRFPKVLPDDLRYLMAGGGELKAGNTVLFEAKEAGGKTIALTRRTFVGKVMSLLFNMPKGHFQPHA